MLTTELLERILARLPRCTVGLVGDLFLDRYFDIEPAWDEPSIETGLVAYQLAGVRCYPGALGTVLNNLLALGVGHVELISCIGDDGEGYSLRQQVAKHPHVSQAGLVVSPERFTPTYTKPMRLEQPQPRELNRLDLKNRTATPRYLEQQLMQHLEAVWDRCDAVVVLDQVSEAECGVMTTAVRDRVSLLARRSPEKFILADSREQIGLFRDVCVKPNIYEANRWVPANGLTPAEQAEHLAKTVGSAVYLTHGANGIHVAWPGSASVLTVPAYPVPVPTDTCGAGDSCTAGIVAAQLAGCSAQEAAAFGQLVASVTVQQIGVTGTASPAQLRQRWQEVLVIG